MKIKGLIPALFFLFFLFIINPLKAQDEVLLPNFPNVTMDLAEGEDLFYSIRHVLMIPGVW